MYAALDKILLRYIINMLLHYIYTSFYSIYVAVVCMLLQDICCYIVFALMYAYVKIMILLL